ncbi:MATE family efflux transporter [Clostridium sp.]|uniref:MATE family efflux transporter n=1 Tax=Clostridium sp. TaxID=1506 RepID=UPI0034640E04
MSKKLDLLNDNIGKIFFTYLIPSIGGMLGTSLYVLADTFFVANGIGSTGLAALNISIPIMNLFNGLGLLFGIGGATALSISRGRKKYNELDDIFTDSIVLCLCTGVFLTLVGLLFLDNIVSFLGGSPDTFGMAKEYLKVIFTFTIAFFLNSTMTVIVRNDGAPKLAMWGMLSGTIANVFLDYIFIFPLGWGMWGAAFATALSPVISLCILSTHFIKKKNNIKLKLPNINVNRVKRILSNGFSSFITELSAGIVIFAFNAVILTLKGDIGVAAYGIIANISLICASIFTGVGQALQPITSVNYGARKTHRVEEAVKFAILTALSLGVVFLLIGFIFPEPITALFNKDNNPELTAITVQGIYLYFVAFIFMGLNIVLISYLQSIEKAKASTLISMCRGLVFILLGLFTLPKFMDINGVWLTMPFAEIGTIILSFVYFKEVRNILSKSAKAFKKPSFR